MMSADRSVPFLDLNTAEWAISTTGSGIRRLLLSKDPATGGFTQALYAPPGFAVPEKSHFADSDHEIFMFEGEFAFDLINPLSEGDYLYRPAGTVYGDSEHSDNGGTQIISFGRTPVKFHLEDPPVPWTGQYLVDGVWSDRPVQPMFVRTADLAWAPSSLPGLEVKRIRGVPGERSATMGASRHSPWAADAAFLLRIPAGQQTVAWWPGSVELLCLAGHGRVGDVQWHRGGYAFGAAGGEVLVEEDLVFYGRWFSGR